MQICLCLQTKIRVLWSLGQIIHIVPENFSSKEAGGYCPAGGCQGF